MRKGFARNFEPLWLARHRPELDHAQVLRVWKVDQASLGMFGGSSAVEYGFDSVLYLADDNGKPSFPYEPPASGTPLKLIALKNRYGMLAEARLDFDGAHATFLDRN